MCVCQSHSFYCCFILFLLLFYLSVSHSLTHSLFSFAYSEISYCFGLQMAPSTGKSPMGTQTSSGSQVIKNQMKSLYSFLLRYLCTMEFRIFIFYKSRASEIFLKFFPSQSVFNTILHFFFSLFLIINLLILTCFQ